MLFGLWLLRWHLNLLWLWPGLCVFCLRLNLPHLRYLSCIKFPPLVLHKLSRLRYLKLLHRLSFFVLAFKIVFKFVILVSKIAPKFALWLASFFGAVFWFVFVLNLSHLCHVNSLRLHSNLRCLSQNLHFLLYANFLCSRLNLSWLFHLNLCHVNLFCFHCF